MKFSIEIFKDSHDEEIIQITYDKLIIGKFCTIHDSI